MKSKQARWLEQESKLWVSDNIISTEQAEKLNARYATDSSTSAFGVSLFGGFGAAILAAGIIALFAYNWEEMHRYAKLLTLFAVFLASHLAGIFCARKERLKTLAAVFHLLGTLLFGANMALISQIYHTGGQLYDLLMVWAFGTLAVAWATTSVINGIVACALLTAWACVYTEETYNTLWIAPLILFLSCTSLAWIRKSYVLLTTTLIATLILVAVNFATWHVLETLDIWFIALATGLVFNAIATVCKKMNSDFNPSLLLKHFAYLFTLGSLFFSSSDIFSWSINNDESTFPFLFTPLALMGISMIVYLLAEKKEIKVPYTIITLIASFLLPALLAFSYLMINFAYDPSIIRVLNPIILVNLALLALALKWMFHGANTTSMYLMVCGSITLATLAGFRFFDTFDSLLWRGICFVVAGGFIFGIGIYYNRIKKEHSAETNNNPTLS